MLIVVRSTRLGYLDRIRDLAGASFWVVGQVITRKFRKQPIEGHILLRQFFERLSGSFVKFGQILSLQIDTLPRRYCDALLSLLDQVEAVPEDQVVAVVEQELGARPEGIYQEFQFPPVGAASIGQVHRAKLIDGTMVAVKIQRPGIRRKFEIDNHLLDWGVRIIMFLRLRRFYFMRDPVRELKTWTEDELDYRREASHCQLLGNNAVGSVTERVPKIFWNLTTSRVLTMEFLQGPSVATYLRMLEEKNESGLAKLREQGLVPAVFGANVISNFLSDAFRYGVFHADLHPANLLILPNNTVGYVDFGIVAKLTAEARRKQIELTLAYSSGDPKAIYEGFLNICKFGSDADLEGLRRRIEQLAGDWYEEHAIGGRVRFRVSVTKTMMDLLSICQDYHVLVDREMIKYIRATILADGLVSRLAPEVDLAGILRRVVEEYLALEAKERVFSRGGAMSLLTDAALWASAGPGPLLHAIAQFERRTFRIKASVDTKRGNDGRGQLRMRAVAAASIWIAVVLTLGLAAGPDGWRTNSLFSGIGLTFVVLWGAWVVQLVRQLLTAH